MHKGPSKAEAFAAHHRGDVVTAERLYNELLRTTPSDAELQYYLGVLCYQGGRASESVTWLRKASGLAPRSLPTLHLLIRVCDELGDAAGALEALDRYLELHPRDVAMRNIRGQQLVRLGRLVEAEQAFRKAAEDGGKAAMFHDLGLCRQLLGNLPAAAAAYQEAIRRGHDHRTTRLWLAQCLRATGRIKEYYETLTDAARSTPQDIELLIEAQSARRFVCDWDSFEHQQPCLLDGLRNIPATGSDPVIPPGILNYLDVDEAAITAAAQRYAGRIAAAGAAIRRKLADPPPRATHTKIRLGYLSTDFFTHAVGSLLSDLFSHHDRNRFEVYGYSLRHRPDSVQIRIEHGCDKYRNLSGSGAEDITRTIIADQIDILIDLAGYTSAAQPAVLAARPAPVQISWLGYLGTSGGDFIDYVIADDVALPPALAHNYSERVIRLPCFLVASPLSAATQHPSREEAGLGENGFVFCSFNQPYKLDRQTFDAWMEILRCVPGSSLWLYTPDMEVCTANLRREAARLNIAPDRIVFAQQVSITEHVARLSLADLALDPFHISGGATNAAALAAGVPVLTLRGESFLARMGSSINSYLAMEDLDCSTDRSYIAKAVELAMSPDTLARVRKRLGDNMQQKGFFDVSRFSRGLEKALQAVWEHHAAGMTAVDIKISEQ